MAEVDIVIAESRHAGRVLGGPLSTSKNRSGRPLGGNGYLAGSFPGGITSVDGTPTRATVRILYRPAEGALGDGHLVAQVESGEDGSWRVEGLDPALSFDIVGRKPGYNDVIVANVRPSLMGE